MKRSSLSASLAACAVLAMLHLSEGFSVPTHLSGCVRLRSAAASRVGAKYNLGSRPTRASRGTGGCTMAAAESQSSMEILKGAISGLPVTGGYSSVTGLFKKFDTDASGQIDQAELALFFQSLGSPLSDEQFKSMMSMMDTSKDGKVDWSEFSTALELAEAELTSEADDMAWDED
mmetsp:Transcript_4097/g.8021  ORF Transcript_4097/g.8021 Transcript_4097/m.8021 type:complete len:175 (-) Transcript_4097:227-751(-)